MKTFDITLTYRTAGGAIKAGHTRQRVLAGIVAQDAGEARQLAKEAFAREREQAVIRHGSRSYPSYKVLRVTVEEKKASAVSPGPVADVLDQIKALLGVSAMDPRIGKTGTITYDGSEKISVTVIAVFNKLSGAERLVIEDDRGLMSIHSAADLSL